MTLRSEPLRMVRVRCLMEWKGGTWTEATSAESLLEARRRREPLHVEQKRLPQLIGDGVV